MRSSLRILHLEDNEIDAELVRSMLEAEGFQLEVKRVETREEYETALHREEFDLIISDFSLPSYDGNAALAFARQKCPNVSFLFVSGTLGEDTAIESLKSEATDYILKHRPERLVHAVRRALQEAEEIVKRRQAEAALRESERRFQLIARATNDVVWDWDTVTNAFWFSDAIKVFGYDPAAIEPTLDFRYSRVHPDDRQRFTTTLQAVLDTKRESWAGEYRFRRGDSSYTYVYDRAHVLRNAAGKAIRVVGAMMDITERKRAEEQIREQAALLDKAQDAIWVNDIDQNILYWNYSAERLYGWTAQEALGKNANELIFHGDLTKPREAFKSLSEWKGELKQVTKTGQSIMVESRWTLLRDQDNKPKSILVINTDVTEKKKIEAQFLRAQRLECIGTLASGIAHDLNNILAPILLSVPMLRWGLSPDEMEKTLTAIEQSAHRGAEVVKQVLTFGRGVAGERILVQPGYLIKEIVKITQQTFPKTITIASQTGADLWPLLGDATQLHQVLLNLAVNARDAMPQGGALSIMADNIQLDAQQAASSPGAKVGPYVLIKVADTGDGIPSEILEKIFDPFFTTKEPGKGTGLGLSTVLGIVKSHGGFLNVCSTAGRGSTFELYLPADVASKPMPDVAVPSNLPRGKGELILVVDDEARIREVTQRTLKGYGYEVMTVAEGTEALNLYASQRQEVKLVLTDMMMPVMDGIALVRALRKIDPVVKVVATSGIASVKGLKNKKAELRELGVKIFLNKPFTAEKLLRAVQAALSEN